MIVRVNPAGLGRPAVEKKRLTPPPQKINKNTPTSPDPTRPHLHSDSKNARQASVCKDCSGEHAELLSFESEYIEAPLTEILGAVIFRGQNFVGQGVVGVHLCDAMRYDTIR